MTRAVLLLALLAWCGGCDSGGTAAVNAELPDSCSIGEQNRFVSEVMQDIYYWVEQMPDATPADFASPEELLEFLVYDELDRFSAIVDAAEEDAFFGDSQFVGVGIGITTREQQLFVTQAFADGPAAAVGLERGFELVSINGISAAEVISGDGVSAAFGPNEIGTQVDLVYRDRAGTEMSATLFKALVTIETVSVTTMFDSGGKKVGYVAFQNFVEPSFEALDTAFAELSDQGVDELVLDLRYNGGGLVSVAEYLAGLIGGTVTDGEIFSVRTHNAQNAFRNVEARFLDETHALDLRRLIVITSAATASASEMVINGLEPFIDVVLVGEATFGKPVGSYGFRFCGKILRPIAFANQNAAGVSDYFDGFAVDCVAADDLDKALGDPQESSLATALGYVANGQCAAAPAGKVSQPAAKLRLIPY